ncbi:MAG: ABC transporter permease [Bacteroidota bacterium]
MINLSRIRLELKKVSFEKIAIIIAISCITPFLFTLFVLYTQSNGISTLAGAFLVGNLVGPWSSLLLGMLVIVLCYVVTEEEQRKNILKLYRPYKRYWYAWIGGKALVIMGILLGVFITNTILSAIALKIISTMISSGETFYDLFLLYLYKFSKAYVFALPCVFFQLLLAVWIKKPVLPVVLGLLLLILGIPVANLSNTYFIPYSYPILSQKPSISMPSLIFATLLIIVFSSLLINSVLSNNKK